MRGIRNYTLREWRRLDPPLWYLKEKRNKIVSHRFINTRSDDLQSFLEQNRHLQKKNIAVVVAFNSPWVIEILLPAMKRYVLDAEILVCDNSNNPDLRPEIEAACKAENILYFPLPKNPEYHPCRSHGIALNWIYYNLIKNLKPRYFSCIDHDLIPFKDIRLSEVLNGQTAYGAINDLNRAWSLWAGYCLFDFPSIENKRVDFNNDRPNQLDTGGMNWKPIYRHLDKTSMKFSVTTADSLRHPTSPEQMEVEILDHTWLHLRGVGQRKERKNEFSHKAIFYTDVFDHVKKGKPLIDFIIKEK